jgi:hypothetical protein
MSRTINLQVVFDDAQARARITGFAEAANQAAAKVNAGVATTASAANAAGNNVANSLTNAAQRGSTALAGMGTNLARHEYALNRIGITTAFIGSVVVRSVTREIGNLTSAVSDMAKEFVNVNEQFSSLEITLSSALRSLNSAREIVSEISRMTATSPLPFKDLARVAQSTAASPVTRASLAEQFASGKGSDPNGYLQRMTRLVEQMSVFRPDQGSEGAIFSIREAMSGQIRSLTRRFDVPSRLLTAITGESLLTLQQNPDKMFRAMEKLFSDIISPEAITQAARQPSKLLQNFREQLVEAPMFRLGNADRRANAPDPSGQAPYQMMLVTFQQMYDKVVAFMSSSFDDEFAPRIRRALEASFMRVMKSAGDSIARVLDLFQIKGSGAGIERMVDAATQGIEKLASGVATLAEGIVQYKVFDKVGTVLHWLMEGLKKLFEVFKFLEGLHVNLGLITFLASPFLLSNAGILFTTFFEKIPNFGLRMLDKVSTTMRAAGVAQTMRADPSMVAPLPPGALNTGGYISQTAAQFARTQIPAMQTAAVEAEKKALAATQRATLMTEQVTAMKAAEVSQRRAVFGTGGTRGMSDTLGMSAAMVTQADIARSEAAAGRAQRYAASQNRIAQRRQGQLAAARLDEGNFAPTSAIISSATSSSFTSSVLNWIGSFAKGMAVAGLVTGALMLLHKAAGALYDAFTLATKAAQDRAEAETRVRNELAKYLDTPAAREKAALAGVPQVSSQAFMNTPEGNKLTERDRLLNALNVNETTGKVSFKDTTPADYYATLAAPVTDVLYKGITAALRPLGSFGAVLTRWMSAPVPGPSSGEQLPMFAEMRSRKTGVTEKNFSDMLQGLVESGKLNASVSDALIRRFAEDPSNAQQQAAYIFDKLNITISDLREWARKAAEDSARQTLEPVESAFAKKFFGAGAATLNEVMQQAADRNNPSEIQGKFANEAGVANVRTRLGAATALGTAGIASEASQRFSTAFDTTFEDARFNENFGTLKTSVEKIRESFVGIELDAEMSLERLAGFMVGAMNQIDEAVAAPGTQDEERVKLSALKSSLEKIFSEVKDPVTGKIDSLLASKAESVRKEVAAAVKEVSPTGILLDTGVPQLSRRFSEISNTLNSLSEEMFDEYMTQLEKTAKAINIPFAKNVKLQRYGSDVEVAASALAVQQDLEGKQTNVVAAAANDDQRKLAMQQLNVITHNLNLAALNFANASNALLDASSNFENGLALPGSKMVGKLGWTTSADEANRRELFPVLSGNDERAKLARQTLMVEEKIRKIQATGEIGTQAEIDLSRQLMEIDRERSKILDTMKPEAMVSGLVDSLRTAEEELYNFAELGKNIGSTIKDSFSDAFGSIVTGTASVADAMRRMAVDITASIAKMFAQKAVMMFFNWMLSSYTGGASGAVTTDGVAGAMNFGGIGTGALGGLVRGGSGSKDDVPMLLMGGEYVINKRAAQSIGYDTLHAMNSGSVGRYAAGGLVGGGSIPSQTSGGGRSPVNISVSITNNGDGSKTTSAEADPAIFQDLADTIADLVDQRLQHQMRPRGMLNPV